MAELNLEVEDYRWLTEMITSVASDHANDRIVSTLEGGYHLRALAESVNAHLEVLNAIHGDYRTQRQVFGVAAS
jgi:acetoin utilization deacetylase AcuC-like enzyme